MSVDTKTGKSAASNYGIKCSYVAREAPEYYLDVGHDAQRKEIIWQPDVYQIAAEIAKKSGATHVIDIGCGTGEKLMEMNAELQTLGIDYGKNLDQCKACYPERIWVEANLETPIDEHAFDPEILAQSVIVCSDVIEHLINPSQCLRSIKNLLNHAKAAVISTPERNLLHGVFHSGPPKNPHHVMEWSLFELQQYCRSIGMILNYSGLTRTNNLRSQFNTILLVASGVSSNAEEWMPLFPRKVNYASYFWRVARKSLGEARARFNANFSS